MASTIVLRIAALIAALLLVFFKPIPEGYAATVDDLDLEQGVHSKLARIESYLNNIRTMRALFAQSSSTGQLSGGQILISRPGRMRIDYDPPVPISVIADGTWLIYHDRALDQVSYIPLSSTPAGILVEDHVSLTAGDLKVTAFDQDGGWWRLTVVRTESPGDGTLTLTFRENPLELKQWIVVDAQGTVTQVSLQDAAFDVPLDPALFQFRDPRIFREGR